jgi:5-methyltetrahydrofolate--homocysteine methyltransferase
LYLRDFCGRLFAQDFTTKQYPEYECAINQFDTWLSEQSASLTPDDAYMNNCDGASGLPLPENVFDQCIISWSQAVDNRDVLQENGTVRILVIDTLASINLMSSIPEIDDEWNRFEKFFKEESTTAPSGSNKFIHASPLWWWFDTNQQMLSTAIGAAGIAIAFSAVVVLFSSRSLTLTFFAGICILYVLAAATATLVGLGWELGFLESVCFAILVGISCDFVIHFGHAYIHFPGHVDRHERTKYAVLHMGPSILAAAATTFAAAVVMLFCKVVFFTKFAMILLMTILHATIGSFVVYIVLNDIFGPAEPTKFIDRLVACGKKDDLSHSTDDDLVLARYDVDDKSQLDVTMGPKGEISQNDEENEVEVILSEKASSDSKTNA